MDVNLELIAEKPQRKEIFNFKDKDSQENFKDLTSNTKEFSNCFDNGKPLEEQINDWRKVLNKHCKIAFKKIRINHKKRMKPIKPNIACLINQRNKLKKNIQDEETKMKIEDIEINISKLEAAENRESIIENFKKFSQNPEKNNLQEMWKVLNKIGPKFKSTVPTAKLNHKRKLISNPDEIKKLLAKEYRQRLRPRPIRPDLGDLKDRREEIFNLQLKIAEENASVPWVMSDLENALKDLKNNKSRDHAGYINEIFKIGVIGSDLKESLLMMFND